MSGRPLTVNVCQRIQEMMKLNDDVVALIRQRQQYHNAIIETKKMMKDIENKKIKHVSVPTNIGIIVRVDGNDKDLKKQMEEKLRQFENALVGIDAQILNRQQNLDEDVKKNSISLANHLYWQDIPIPDYTDPRPAYFDGQKKAEEKKKKTVVEGS